MSKVKGLDEICKRLDYVIACLDACAGADDPKPGELARLRRMRNGFSELIVISRAYLGKGCPSVRDELRFSKCIRECDDILTEVDGE